MDAHTTQSPRAAPIAGIRRGVDRVAGRVLRSDVAAGLLASLLATGIAARVLQLWRADLDVPFAYARETQYYLMLVKDLLADGRYLDNARLGAPFGQELYDLAPTTDRLHFLILRLLGLFSSDAAVVTNLFFLLTFPLAAATAFLSLRLLRVSPSVSVLCAVLFALLPYHFVRAEGHLFLAAYYTVPLGAYLVLAVGLGQPLFRRRSRAGPGLLAYASGSSLLTLALCVAVGSGGVYYAAFTLFLLAGVTAVAFAARRERSSLVIGGIVTGLVAATLAVNLAPTLRYQWEHGTNSAIERPAEDTEVYGLKLADLLFPTELHRIDRLSNFISSYRNESPVPSESGMALGPVAAAGFLWLLVVALVGAVGARWTLAPPLARYAAVAILIAVLLGTIGGISTVVAQLVNPQLRAWNRISVVIAFFAFLGVALLLDALRRRLDGSTARRVLFAAVLAGILVFGVYNQTTYAHIPPYELKATYQQDRDFVRTIESRLPRGASVFQLPYVAFPEAGQVVDLVDYDLVRGYLHSEELRWSYGAMRGRPEDWADDLAPRPIELVVAGVSAAGFDGIVVDRAGYADRAGSLETSLRSLLGVEPLVNASQRHSFFDLRPYADRLRQERSPAAVEQLRLAVLEPLSAAAGDGMWRLEYSGGKAFTWAIAPRSEILVTNPSDHTEQATLEVMLDRLGGSPAEVTVSYPPGKQARYPTPSAVRLSLELPPGTHVIRFAVDAPLIPGRQGEQAHYIRLAGLAVTDRRITPFLEAHGRR